jgi:hypothetical protein
MSEEKKRLTAKEKSDIQRIRSHPFLDDVVLEFINMSKSDLEDSYENISIKLGIWKNQSTPWFYIDASRIMEHLFYYDPGKENKVFNTYQGLERLQDELRSTLKKICDAVELNELDADSVLYLIRALQRLASASVSVQQPENFNFRLEFKQSTLSLSAQSFYPIGFDTGLWVLLYDLLQQEGWHYVVYVCSNCGNMIRSARRRSRYLESGGIFCSNQCRAAFYMRTMRNK